MALADVLNAYNAKIQNAARGFQALDPNAVNAALQAGGSLGGVVGFNSSKDVMGLTPENFQAAMKTYQNPAQVIEQASVLNEAITGNKARANAMINAANTEAGLAGREATETTLQNQRFGNEQNLQTQRLDADAAKQGKEFQQQRDMAKVNNQLQVEGQKAVLEFQNKLPVSPQEQARFKNSLGIANMQADNAIKLLQMQIDAGKYDRSLSAATAELTAQRDQLNSWKAILSSKDADDATKQLAMVSIMKMGGLPDGAEVKFNEPGFFGWAFTDPFDVKMPNGGMTSADTKGVQANATKTTVPTGQPAKTTVRAGGQYTKAEIEAAKAELARRQLAKNK